MPNEKADWFFIMPSSTKSVPFSLNLMFLGTESAAISRRGSKTQRTFREISDDNQWYFRANARELQSKPAA